MTVADFYHFEVTRVKGQSSGAEKCFSTLRDVRFNERFLLPEHTTAGEKGRPNAEVQKSHTQQDGKGGVRQAGQNHTGSYHEEKEDKKTGAEKLPDSGILQSGNACQIFSAAPGKQEPAFDNTQQESYHRHHPGPDGAWKKGNGSRQKATAFYQQNNPTQAPNESSQKIQQSDTSAPSVPIIQWDVYIICHSESMWKTWRILRRPDVNGQELVIVKMMRGPQ